MPTFIEFFDEVIKIQTVQKPLESRRKKIQRLQRMQKYVRLLDLYSNEEYDGLSTVCTKGRLFLAYLFFNLYQPQPKPEALAQIQSNSRHDISLTNHLYCLAHPFYQDLQ